MLGERICLLRRWRGWNQAELAKQIRVSPSTVGMYEQGRREPALGCVVLLSRAFGVSADYLLTGRPLTSEDRQAVREMTEKSLAALVPRRGGFSKEEMAVLLEAVLTET